MKLRGLLPALLAVVGAILLVAPGSASALSLDPVDEFDAPVFVTSDPGDADRLFVVEKGGTIELLDHGVRRSFLDITDQVAGDGERGLLSMAFDPGYATNKRFYVYFSDVATGNIEVAEFEANTAGTAAVPATQRPIITVPHPTYGNHNGGQLQTGPDGYLYVGTGDGGGGGDPNGNGQDTEILLGKILRIDPDPRTPGADGYTIPPDNPFVGVPGRDEIWAYGVRNPWRFSFDRSTGDLLIGDVGQNAWEEIDLLPQADGGGRGANLGWDACEANHLFEGTIPGVTNPTRAQQSVFCNSGGRTGPVFEYPHDSGRCSVTGGYVSRDPGIPAYDGRYFYADICEGRIHTVLPGTGAPGGASGDRDENLAVGNPSSFGEDACGRLYVASLGSGTVSRIEGPTPTVCGDDQPPPPPPPPPQDRGPCRVSTQLGDDGQNELIGGPGFDALTGLGGPDRLDGGANTDCLAGGRGADTLIGGAGKDRFYPAAGRDTVDGGRGGDKIRSADGTRDRIECGSGRDVVHGDPEDRVAEDCERVRGV